MTSTIIGTMTLILGAAFIFILSNRIHMNRAEVEILQRKVDTLDCFYDEDEDEKKPEKEQRNYVRSATLEEIDRLGKVIEENLRTLELHSPPDEWFRQSK